MYIGLVLLQDRYSGALNMGQLHPTMSSNPINQIINRLLLVSFETNKTTRKILTTNTS